MRRLAQTLALACAVLLPLAPLGAQSGETSGEPSFMTTLGELVWQGGVLMIPIGACSILTLGLAIERLWALRRGAIIPDGLWSEVRQDLRDGQVDAVRAKVSSGETPLARVVHAGLIHWKEATADVKAGLEDAGLREADDLQKHLPALQGIASVAPLMGLLGTVVGMIRSFYVIAKESAMGNPGLFAEPIGQALVTTAAGLTVAIPALILFYFFRGRIRELVRRLDDVSREVLACHREGRLA